METFNPQDYSSYKLSTLYNLAVQTYTQPFPISDTNVVNAGAVSDACSCLLKALTCMYTYLIYRQYLY